MQNTLLVRYGNIPEVARFTYELPAVPARGERVVVQTHRGLELGTALEMLRKGVNGHDHPDDAAAAASMIETVVRAATSEDEQQAAELQAQAQRDFPVWQDRLREWKLDLELIDLEWTLDRQKLVLYVLGGRGPDTTRLAILAAAAGLAVIEVQPVSADGLVPLPAEGGGGGCGSGGGGCGCH